IPGVSDARNDKDRRRQPPALVNHLVAATRNAPEGDQHGDALRYIGVQPFGNRPGPAVPSSGPEPAVRTSPASGLGMTGTVVTACFVTGLITGWFLRTVFVMAEISRSQQRMQNKIHYWQSETLYARHQAAPRASLLTTRGYPTPDAYNKPPRG